ncbi:MAG: double zinc ribbon domain-containing protein [Vicinamibacteria bacterium]
MTVALLATLGATVVAFVLYPVFAQARSGSLAGLGDAEREILDLEEKKSRLYEALTDLDFEKEAGKVSEADYETARNDYMAQAAAVLAKLEALAPRKGEKKKPRKAAESAPERRCGSCSKSSPESAKFCSHCGAPFAPSEATCEGCGEKLPKEARFCMGCGKKVPS